MGKSGRRRTGRRIFRGKGRSAGKSGSGGRSASVQTAGKTGELYLCCRLCGQSISGSEPEAQDQKDHSDLRGSSDRTDRTCCSAVVSDKAAQGADGRAGAPVHGDDRIYSGRQLHPGGRRVRRSACTGGKAKTERRDRRSCRLSEADRGGQRGGGTVRRSELSGSTVRLCDCQGTFPVCGPDRR